MEMGVGRWTLEGDALGGLGNPWARVHELSRVTLKFSDVSVE